MGQKQDELLKRIQKLVKKNQDLFDKNERLQKAVTELSEQNEMMKMQLKEKILRPLLGITEQEIYFPCFSF